MNRKINGVGWLFGLAMIAGIVLIVSRAEEERKILELLKHVHLFWFGLASLIQVFTYYQQGAVWWITLKRFGQPKMLHRMARLSIAKLFIDQALPSAGVSGIVFVHQALKRQNVESERVMAVLAINIASYYLAYALMVSLALLSAVLTGILNSYILLSGLIFDLVLILVVVFIFTRGQKKKKRRWLKWPWLEKKLLPVTNAMPLLRAKRGLLFEATFFQILVFVTDAATVWFLLFALGVSAPMMDVFSTYILSSVARTLSIIPGGLGIFEAAAIGSMSLTGIPASAALMATLLFRGLSFWLPMIPGFVISRWETRQFQTS